MRALVITSIAGPTPGLRALAAQAQAAGLEFVLVGDEPSPPDVELDGCDVWSLERQRGLDLAYARVCPVRSYTRKNLGYLIAIERGAESILETDDDTVAYESFWQPRERTVTAHALKGHGWVNVYRYWSDATIWPRGFPLELARERAPALDALPVEEADCPIQQGLVDDDPDVDAVYRMLLELPLRFDQGPPVALAEGTWSPFNSQNTMWWPDAYPLLYLPATCPFRLTDIWRSFVAQRIAWLNGWSVLFHEATVSQERNVHDLMVDFREEVPGYLGNRAIRAALEELPLRPGRDVVPANMRLAYARLVEGGWLQPRELELLDAWLADLALLGHRPAETGDPLLD